MLVATHLSDLDGLQDDAAGVLVVVALLDLLLGVDDVPVNQKTILKHCCPFDCGWLCPIGLLTLRRRELVWRRLSLATPLSWSVSRYLTGCHPSENDPEEKFALTDFSPEIGYFCRYCLATFEPPYSGFENIAPKGLRWLG